MSELDRLHPSGRVRELKFKDFLPFVHMEGEKAGVKQRFVSFLSDLFDISLDVWNPAGCYATEYLEKKVKELLETKYLDIHAEPRSFGGGAHFWLVAVIDGIDKQLIIDPFGIYTPGKDYMKDKQTIIPFFGLVEKANLFAQDIYKKGEPLESGVYHIFHP